MPDVTLTGGGGSTVTIPVSSSASAQIAQNALAAISAGVANNSLTPVVYSGTVPTSGATALIFNSPTAQTVNIPVNSVIAAQVSSGNAPLTVSTAATNAATVVSGQGGVTYTQSAPTVTGSLIYADGGQNVINLAAGANTVSVGNSPVSGGTGTSTVNALAGGAVVNVNAFSSGAVLVVAAGSDSVNITGLTALVAADSSVAATVRAGGAAYFGGAQINVAMAAGSETIGVYTGSTQSITGASIGGGTLYVGGAGPAGGSAIINANSHNVTVFSGQAATTLFGGTGSDYAVDVRGRLSAGTGGNTVLISSANISGPATTLIGGGVNDILYAQSSNVSLRGAAGTALMVAGGMTISGGTLSIGTGAISTAISNHTGQTIAGAAGGATIDAGASNAFIYGSTTGSNTIISGSGSATVIGRSGAFSAAGNTYLDGAAGGRMTIADFSTLDTFKLTGSQAVSSVAAAGAGSVVTLSDGTSITILDGAVTSSNVSTYFHT